MSARSSADPAGDRIRRISAMEGALEAAAAALTRLESALEDYNAARDSIDSLAAYYESPVWLSDYEADERGELPGDLPRGVLSQDTLWDLFTLRDDLCRKMAALAASRDAADRDPGPGQ